MTIREHITEQRTQRLNRLIELKAPQSIIDFAKQRVTAVAQIKGIE